MDDSTTNEQSFDLFIPESDSDSCDHCSRDANETRNGTNLCEEHLQEYMARHEL